MVKKTLVSELIEDGARLLHELDKHNFPVEAMFWVELPDRDYWRLVIASPIVATQGPKAAYSKVAEVLRGIHAAGLDLAEISVFAPDSQQFRDLLAVAERSGGPVTGPDWVVLSEAVVYRWNGQSLTAELGCHLSEPQLAEIWEAERESGNLPKLLFNVVGRRVTLRFHPEHAKLGGLAEGRRNFQIALHRHFPKCTVKWID